MELILLPFLDSGLWDSGLPIFGILCNRCFQMPYSSLSFVAQDLIAFQHLPELYTKKLLVHACY